MLTPFGTALLPYINDIWTETSSLIILLQIISMRNVAGHHLRPNRHNYLFIQTCNRKIKDISDITLSLKTCNLERKPFMKASNFLMIVMF